LALFGYDAVEYQIGRGVLESLGINFDLGPSDVAARGNFCTVDAAGDITDRRAGRIPTSKCVELVEKLRPITLPGVEVFVEPVQDYRFCLVLRGAGLNAQLDDTDPQRKAPPLLVKARVPAAQPTADLVNDWIAQAREILKNESPANALTLRGFAVDPSLPKFPQVYQLRAACVAVYPMYKGVSKLVGMDIIQFEGGKPEDEFKAVADNWAKYDFFFIHIKYTDSRGEDGDFEAKAKVIEGVDAALPQLLALKPDVLIVTGDHSTPSVMKSHSWHPLPTLLWAPGTTRRDKCKVFGETEAIKGALGRFPSTDLMPLALAHAKRLQKLGA
jgi:2,3-bisphosphoglycerate-independent phosphoglycerate mutase